MFLVIISVYFPHSARFLFRMNEYLCPTFTKITIIWQSFLKLLNINFRKLLKRPCSNNYFLNHWKTFIRWFQLKSCIIKNRTWNQAFLNVISKILLYSHKKKISRNYLRQGQIFLMAIKTLELMQRISYFTDKLKRAKTIRRKNC